jgi:ribonuclease E
VVSALAACSALPSSAKPDAIYGEAKPAPTPEGTTGFPDLADVPDSKPKVTSAQDQKALADSLAADRAAARASDKDLRAGGVLPPAKGSDVKAPSEATMQADAIEPSAPVASTQKMAEQAPVVEQPKPAPTTETAAPAAPVTPVAPVAAAAPAVSPVAVTSRPPSVAEEPAAKPAMVAQTSAVPSEESAEAAKPAIQLPPGVIGMPPRGGHASFEDILTPEQKAERKLEAAEAAKKAPVAAKAPESDSDQVTAAPTTPVEVNPVPQAQ